MTKVSNKIGSIEWLRFTCILAVIMIHTCVTINTNYTISDVGFSRYMILEIIHNIFRFAVPCFLMITGALLLDENKKVTEKKNLKYLKRAIILLVTFGYFYCLIEIFFNTRKININLFAQSFLNLIEGKSWAHMWYMYSLVGFYIILIPLKRFIDNSSKKEIRNYLIIFAIIGNAVYTLNNLFSIKIYNFAMLNNIILYPMLGYYLYKYKDDFIDNQYKYYITGLVSLLINLVYDFITLKISMGGKNTTWITNYGNIFVLLYSTSIFLLFILNANKPFKTNFLNKINECGLYIYLIHPFFINFIYKFLVRTPLDLPIVIGIIVYFAIITICSIICAMIISKIIKSMKARLLERK